MNSLTPGPEPTKPEVKVGPILHLLRHAEVSQQPAVAQSVGRTLLIFSFRPG